MNIMNGILCGDENLRFYNYIPYTSTKYLVASSLAGCVHRDQCVGLVWVNWLNVGGLQKKQTVVTV